MTTGTKNQLYKHIKYVDKYEAMSPAPTSVTLKTTTNLEEKKKKGGQVPISPVI